MRELTTDLPFVVCKHCIRGFDVDHWDNQFRNTRKISETTQGGETVDIEIEAECPHCFGMAQCKMAKDYYWTVESGDREVDLANKRLQMTDAEMEALRKDRMALKDIITLLQRDLKEVKRDRARVRKEAERLANIIHLAEKNAKPRTDRRAKPEEKRPSYVG